MVGVVAVVDYRRHLLLRHTRPLHAHECVATEPIRVMMHAGSAMCICATSWIQYSAVRWSDNVVSAYLSLGIHFALPSAVAFEHRVHRNKPQRQAGIVSLVHCTSFYHMHMRYAVGALAVQNLEHRTHCQGYVFPSSILTRCFCISAPYLLLFMQFSLKFLVDAVKHHSLSPQGVYTFPKVLVHRQRLVKLHQRLQITCGVVTLNRAMNCSCQAPVRT